MPHALFPKAWTAHGPRSTFRWMSSLIWGDRSHSCAHAAWSLPLHLIRKFWTHHQTIYFWIISNKPHPWQRSVPEYIKAFALRRPLTRSFIFFEFSFACDSARFLGSLWSWKWFSRLFRFVLRPPSVPLLSFCTFFLRTNEHFKSLHFVLQCQVEPLICVRWILLFPTLK